MKLRVSLIVLAVVLALPALSSVARPQIAYGTTVDPAAIVTRFYELVFRGDVDGAMTFWADDAVMSGRPLCPVANPCKGKAAIRLEVAREAADHNRNTLLSIGGSRESFETREEQRSDRTSLAGIERRIVLNTWETRGDLISANQFKEDPSGSDPQSVIFANDVRLSIFVGARRTALNNGNVAGLLTPLTDDAVLEGLGLCTPSPCRGKAAIQREVEREIADHTQQAAVLVRGFQRAVGNVHTERNELRSDSIRAAGVERVLFTLSTEVSGTSISALRFVLDTSDPQTATFLSRGAGIRPPSTGDGGLLPTD